MMDYARSELHGLEALYEMLSALEGLRVASPATTISAYEKVERAAVAVNYASLASLDDPDFSRAAQDIHSAFIRHCRQIRQHKLPSTIGDRFGAERNPMKGQTVCQTAIVEIARILDLYMRSQGILIGGRSPITVEHH